jgi:hypothetical protein
LTIVTRPALVTVHTDGVDDVYVTANGELVVAPRLNGAALASISAGWAKVITWPVRIVND